MPGPLPVELRWRVVDGYELGGDSFRDTGLRFKVGEASVNRWVQLFRRTGSVEPKPHAGGPEAHIRDDQLDKFRAIIDRNADAILPQLAEICTKEFRISVSPACVVRTCKRANITRKKRP